MDALDELVPPASSSASKPLKRPSYDVFINHRGEDVKSTVASILYGMLTRCHLSVFLDEPELEYGDFFPQILQAAMSSALVHIAIFSERYAESPWCLAELSFMVKSGAPIIPIFYHVDPSDLRRVHQGKGKYVDAFDRYVQKNRYLGKLNEWKKALYKASFYKGEIVKNKDDEDRQLKDIVNTVLKIVKRESLWVADYPVGRQTIRQEAIRQLAPNPYAQANTSTPNMPAVNISPEVGNNTGVLNKAGIGNKQQSVGSQSGEHNNVQFGGINNEGNNSGVISKGDGNTQAAGKTNYGSSTGWKK